MDILWAAVGISLIVGFVLYVVAGHWTRVLRDQASVIRRLSDRLRLVEQVDNPQFRERISESAPPPLEQVFTFSFRLSDRFWRETLHLCESDWNFVRSFGSFVGSVKLERWRSHSVATITEVLPTRKTAAWQTRSVEFYPAHNGQGDELTLWKIPLAEPKISGPQPTLELSLSRDSLELFVSHGDARVVNSGSGASENGDAILFRAPLDAALLAEFRSQDLAENGSPASNGTNAIPWQTFYSWEDEARGIEWQLHVRDLGRKAQWERFRILESPAAPLIRNGL